MVTGLACPAPVYKYTPIGRECAGKLTLSCGADEHAPHTG